MSSYIRRVAVLVFLFGLGATSLKADTASFTFVSPLNNPDTPGEVVSFTLQQGQARDLIQACGCENDPEGLNAISEYFNVPILVNGVSETSNVRFCDRACDLFTQINVWNLGFLYGNADLWTGLLTAPQFTPGTYQSMVSCFGEILPQCGNFPNTNPLLTIAVTADESSTLPLVMLGSAVVFGTSFLKRLRRAGQN